MHPRRAGALAIALSGVSGVVAAHAIGFVVAIPDGGERARVLQHTGHGYWSIAIVAAIIAATIAVVARVQVGIRRGREQQRAGGRSRHARSARGEWAQLAAWQVALFSAMEATERIESGERLSALLAEPAFRIGLVVQLVVAAVTVTVLAVAAALGELSVARTRAVIRTIVAARVAVPAPSRVARRPRPSSRSTRAPPATAWCT